ncbi:hypothetical protein TIFTF001_016163 [Ficus carica]|uniref:Uncharacterized protein n=1 Tax=Ficus carica TaxID=3494 RepID=A0AA88D8I4_FICCA|nr:hypothetical protein TIFTF001_016163 [Ficus carica]
MKQEIFVASFGRRWEISTPRRASRQTVLTRSPQSFLLTTEITVARNSREHWDHPSSLGLGRNPSSSLARLLLRARFLQRSISLSDRFPPSGGACLGFGIRSGFSCLG